MKPACCSRGRIGVLGSPEGATENSPGCKSWDAFRLPGQVPKGRLNRVAHSLPVVALTPLAEVGR